MKKSIIFLNKHKFSTFVIIMSLTLSILSAYYAWDLAKDTKDIDVKRSIYQLGVTAIAASVGIGTIINSTRSASVAAESMKVTKNKEVREQSSHIIPLSSIGYFPLIAPFYKENFNYMLDRFNASVEQNLINKSYKEGHEILEEFENERKEYLDSFQSNRFDLLDDNFVVKLVNIGKGSCVNLEYTFEFTNIQEFIGYKIDPNYDLISKSVYGNAKPISYSIEITSELELKFKDQYLEKFIDEEYKEWRSLGNGTEYNYKIQKNHVTEYTNIVKPSEEIDIYLPDEFLMLCRHYMNIKYLNHEQNNGRFEFEKNKGYLKDWLVSKTIKPIGELKISFFEESLIRAGKIDSNKRTELTYRVSLKDIEVKFKNDEVRYYLEINLSSSEKII